MNSVNINDEFIDLNDVTIATTFQNGSIGALASRNVSYSNAFKVPKTERNRRILGFADLLSSQSSKPYLKLPSRILQNGIQIIKGTAAIREASDAFNLNIYEVLSSAFANMGDKLLSELDFGDAPITWNAAYIDSVRKATSGFVAPVIQYGQIDTGPVTPAIGSFPLPSIYVREVFNRVFLEAGVLIDDTFINTDDYYSKLVFAYSRPDFPGLVFSKADILPDVKQIDFVKEITVMFGLKYADSGVGSIVIKSFKSILNDRATAVNWTNKRSKRFDDIIRFKFEDFAQFNTFDESLGASITVPNENLELVRNVYNRISFSPYSNSFTVNDGGSTISGAWIKLWNALPAGYPPTDPFDETNKLRFLLVRPAFTGAPLFEPAMEYDGNSRSDYFVGYYENFDVNLGYKTLAWISGQNTGLLEKYYASLQTALQKCKVITRLYYLTEMDIHNLELTKLVVDSGEYFLINKVNAFVPGQLTKVDMLKI